MLASLAFLLEHRERSRKMQPPPVLLSHTWKPTRCLMASFTVMASPLANPQGQSARKLSLQLPLMLVSYVTGDCMQVSHTRYVQTNRAPTHLMPPPSAHCEVNALSVACRWQNRPRSACMTSAYHGPTYTCVAPAGEYGKSCVWTPQLAVQGCNLKDPRVNAMTTRYKVC